MSEYFDGRGLKCPLAFVKAKQHLVKFNTKVYLLDDDISLYNFTQYLTKCDIPFIQDIKTDWVQITIMSINEIGK